MIFPSSTTPSMSSSTTIYSTSLANPPTFISYKGMRFLIMDAPSDMNLHLYIQEMQKYHVIEVVRVCKPTYNKERLIEKNIQVHEWLFDDGDPPSSYIVNGWLSLVDAVFFSQNKMEQHRRKSSHRGSKKDDEDLQNNYLNVANNSAQQYLNAKRSSSSDTQSVSQATSTSSNATEVMPTIAVHCIAGLGRAPVLVAIALIEHGMSPLDSVQYIRERRRGAINNKQLKYLESYKKRGKFNNQTCIVI